MATNDPFNLNTEYGFPEPPSEEMLQALMAQMQGGNTAKAAQPRLEKQMLQAEQLRDRPGPKSTHWLSGLAQLGNTAAGIRDVRSTKAEQKSGEEQLGSSLAAQQKSVLDAQSRKEGTALANTRLAMANRDEDYERETGAAETEAAALARHQGLERQNRIDVKGMGSGKPTKANNYGKPERIIIGATGEEENADFDPATRTYTITGGDRKGELVPYSDTYVPGDLGLKTQTERKFWSDTKGSLERANKYQSKSPEYWDDIAQPLRDSGMPSSIMHKFIRLGETEGVYKWIDRKDRKGNNVYTEKQRARVLKSMQVLSDIGANVVNPFIEEGIAGAASDRDVDRLLSNILIEGGTSGALMHQQVNQLFDTIRTTASEKAKAYQQYGDREAYHAGRNAQKYLDAYVPYEAPTTEQVAPEEAGQAGRPPEGPPPEVQQMIPSVQEAIAAQDSGTIERIRQLPGDHPLRQALALIEGG